MGITLNPFTGQLDLVGSGGGSSGITALTGDVSASGPGSAAATVNSVGGSTASAVNTATVATNSATSANTPNAIVKRDGSGNFAAGTITATLSGNATNVTGVVAKINGGTGADNSAVTFPTSGIITPSASSLTASRALATDPSGLLASSSTTSTELGYVSGVTSAIQTQLDAKIPLTQKGASLGVATLDSGGKVPVTQLPNTVMEFQGAWDPSTNTPALADASGTPGDVYRVSVAAAGPIAGLTDPSMVGWQVGDFVIYAASISKWQRAPASDGVISVNGAQGVVTVNAINQLTGDVTAGPASGSSSAAATISNLSRAKLAAGSVGQVVINDPSTGILSSEAQLAKSRGGTGADNSSVTFPSTGIIVTEAGTETLTNKTIATASNSITSTANRAAQFNASTGILEASSVTDTELGYVSGATSNIQTQINAVTGGLTPSDIPLTSFTAAASQTSQPITGLTFANGTVRAFRAMVSVTTSSGLYENFELAGIQRAADWQMEYKSVGDVSTYTFNINTSGQVLYTSGATTATVKFRATTTTI